MAKILHVCNSFDPAGDVVRCVKELQRYSKHEHRLIVRELHPIQETLQYPVWPNSVDPAAEFNWADAIIYQFVGWSRGWGILPSKPTAFRNINIRYDPTNDRFWAEDQYNDTDLSPYKLLASSHAGARDFMGWDKFRELPDLIPIDEYTPDFTVRRPCISYIKHADELDGKDLGVSKLRLLGTAHSEVIRRRKHEATCIIDNVCDGHYGLAGLEAMALGLATVVFNHPFTQASLHNMAPEYPPFVECGPYLDSAVRMAHAVCNSTEVRIKSRLWMEKYYHSQRIIEMYWDTFVEELLG